MCSYIIMVLDTLIDRPVSREWWSCWSKTYERYSWRKLWVTYCSRQYQFCFVWCEPWAKHERRESGSYYVRYWINHFRIRPWTAMATEKDVKKLIGFTSKQTASSVSFSWSVEQNAQDTQMTTRVTEGARQESPRFSRLPASPLNARTRVHSPYYCSQSNKQNNSFALASHVYCAFLWCHCTTST